MAIVLALIAGFADRNQRLARTGGRTGADFAEKFRAMAERGVDVHGEAAFCADLVRPGSRVLDAGCGTGRVAIELHRRGYHTLGVDIDRSMLAEAVRAAPQLPWISADLATLDLPALGMAGGFDLVVLAGNVMVNLAPGTEPEVVARMVRHMRPGGLLVAGFRLDLHLTARQYAAHCARAGLTEVDRWSDWRRGRDADSGFAVFVHTVAH
ncbi:class I SAM-dependent methyltransferase [Streptomyces sp. NPDC052301]|uniref:class I SAM-dependent methyltransferase n=1 Tax=Streptomyces sp. NPDC052301 TaxID=3365687 RepID=UPI0037CF3267